MRKRLVPKEGSNWSSPSRFLRRPCCVFMVMRLCMLNQTYGGAIETIGSVRPIFSIALPSNRATTKSRFPVVKHGICFNLSPLRKSESHDFIAILVQVTGPREGHRVGALFVGVRASARSSRRRYLLAAALGGDRAVARSPWLRLLSAAARWRRSGISSFAAAPPFIGDRLGRRS